VRFHKLEESVASLQAVMGFCEKPSWRQASESLCGLLRSAQKFYCGDLRELPSMKDYTAYPMLPFPMAAFEYSGDGCGHFCLAWEGQNQSEPDLSALFYTLYPEGCAFIGRVLLDRQKSTLSVANPLDMQSDALLEEGKSLLSNHFRKIGDFLAVLNCVNVNTEVVVAPSALNKKRAKCGKPPIYEYKVLVLRPPAAQRIDRGGTHESPRIHLRRGHIKRRKTGNFWWQPCVVGDRKRGVVVKDYRADEVVAH
jgi:hypothetical protein